MKIFYCCWNPNSRNPMIKHDTIDEAEQEAVRIATKEMTPVHILELRATCTVEVKAKWEYPYPEPLVNTTSWPALCPICNHLLLRCICDTLEKSTE